ncbi:PREDICTED: metastasis-associated protein MTA3-like [Rhagoletis zephyria]|uniref:metastasis-associated protein MTA3-like n=1 Tax=Rhagoletis zephyria TaxID=28612 RepID=UPI000811359D|nr:PREDICTED: metastasis-associated protein MTA3-like [Rhagoletis zephyria]
MSQLRGKCVVVQFVSEVEDPKDYVKLKDTFFYRLKYKHISSTTGNGHGNGSGSSSNNNNNNGNSMQQPFLYPLEEGSMRVGAEYQAVVPPFALSQEEQAVHYKDHSPETLCYTPKHNLSEDDIEGFVKVCQSVSTFGRTKVLAFVLPAEEQQLPPPGALEVGASSVRDYTTQCAMDMLHIYNYDIGAATLSLVPKEKPVICHEPLQNWTTEEVARFREGFEKVGKNFRALRQQYLPQKELGHIVTFYYMMKHFLSLKGRTTDGSPPSQQQKQLSLSETRRSSDGSPQSQQQKQLSPSETSSGGGGGGSRTLYGKSSGGGVTKAKTAATKSSLIANNNNHHHNIGHRLGCKRMLKSIDIPERYHTDCHALSPEKSRRCDSCLATLLCRTYPAGMLVYALCLDCRAHWQRMASFRILDA